MRSKSITNSPFAVQRALLGACSQSCQTW